MADENGNFVIFHPFPNLPPEIRSQIWCHALPRVKPGIHFYRKGCWIEKYLTPSEGDPTATEILVARFDHDQIKKRWLVVPTIHVNREARRIALRWGRQHHLQLCFVHEFQALVFLQSYNPQHDALFVSSDMLELFFAEFWEPEYNGRFLNRNFTPEADVEAVIISQSSLQRCIRGVERIFTYYDSVRHFFISTSDIELTAGVVDHAYQYRRIAGMSLSWNIENQRFDTDEGDEKNARPELNALLKQAAERFAMMEFSRGRLIEFYIIPVEVHSV